MLYIHWIDKPGGKRAVSDGPFEFVQLTYDSIRTSEVDFDAQFIGKRDDEGWIRARGDRHDGVYSDVVINEDGNSQS